MAKSDPIIRLENVHKSFGGPAVLDGVSLSFHPGQTTVVIGPSGCGKTVLLKHIVALERPDSGAVYFDSERISEMTERQLVAVRRRMGFLFQGGALFDSMTVEGNVCFPLAEHGVGTARQQRQRCGEVLAQVGLGGLQERYPNELSGGQKRRVALARAIVLRPEVILYDEPTTGLDPIRADLINELILRLQAAMGTTAVVVTHDLSSARKVGDRIVMLHEGRIVIDTTPDKLEQTDNEVVARFVQGRASAEELAEIQTGTAGTAGQGKASATEAQRTQR